MRTILAMLTSIGIVLHLQSSGSGLIPLPIKGWYKYTAVTEVTCPVEVSVPVMCSLPVSACRGVHSFRDVSWLRECPRRVLYPFLLVSAPRASPGVTVPCCCDSPGAYRRAAACPTSLWTVAPYGSTRQSHQFLDGGTLYLAGCPSRLGSLGGH